MPIRLKAIEAKKRAPFRGPFFIGLCRPVESLPVVILRHEGQDWATDEADLAVQRLDNLTGRRTFWLEDAGQVLRREGIVGRQVRVTEVRRLDVRGHRRVVVVTHVEPTTDGEERLT